MDPIEPEIHLFEPSGYAGVFQHACGLGVVLARQGHRVVLHTGHEHEAVHIEGARLCPCSWWPRAGGGPGRKAAIGATMLRRTLPHLHRAAPPGAVVHIQGIAAAGPLNLLTLFGARLKGRRVVYSPHDTFSRRGRVDEQFLRWAARVPHAVVVHSAADVERLGARGVRAHLSPLVQLVPTPSPEDRMRWRRTWRAEPSQTVVLFAGFIRPEKRLDVLVDSARHWPPGRRLVVVGQDRGGWARADLLARTHGVDVHASLGFTRLTDFAAAICAADLVVVPSERASQSGVLALARELCTPSLAADVGGMPELATGVFAVGDPADLNRAIDAQLAGAVPRARAGDADDALSAHLRAYRLSANGSRP